MKVNEQGFVTNFLVAGPKCTPVEDVYTGDNQLSFEKMLRSKIVNQTLSAPSGDIRIGRESRIGLPWHYHAAGANWFIDYGTFYFTLQKVEIEGATILISPEERDVKIRLWSYCTVCLWCNGEHVLFLSPSVYKPIKYMDAVLHLHAGENLITLSLQTLGVRDTRTLWGLQLLDGRTGLEVSLPDRTGSAPMIAAEAFLGGICLKGNELLFPEDAPEGTQVLLDSDDVDFAHKDRKTIALDAHGVRSFLIPSRFVHVAVEVKGICRSFMVVEHAKASYSGAKTEKESLDAYLHLVASVSSLSRGTFGFAMPHLLARKALGWKFTEDESLFMESLEQIKSRYDCSDFLVVSLLRYIHEYGYPSKRAEIKAKEVLSDFRYWMDMDGADAMCFWSENHSLQFYSCTYLAGRLYPDMFFTRARLTGSQLALIGRKRLMQWLDDVGVNGLEEFTSACYMCMSSACLLNLIDYGDEEVAAKAKAILDKIMEIIACHVFDGSLIAPMGRIYGDVILPYAQGAQTLVSLIDPAAPEGNADEPWLSAFATTGYQIDENLKARMREDVDTSYTSGSALIMVRKRKGFILTSVQSPRQDEGYVHWINTTLTENPDRACHHYVKSLNERFHGTTDFNPGIFGYQQHMWVCGLGNDTVVFANHPGGTHQDSSMRPGYWYGNGIMPAVKQEGSMLGAIYSIPSSHPIQFTHLYFPRAKFDEVLVNGSWIFGRKGNGCVGVWLSGDGVPFDDALSGCEIRLYEMKSAYVLFAGEGNDLASFAAECKAMDIRFDKEMMMLFVDGKEFLGYKAKEDKTQYL